MNKLKTKVNRIPDRGHYDAETIYKIIDEALFCHVGFIDETEDGLMPVVIPTIHARSGDQLFFHGAKASRLLKRVGSGFPICITITLLDGLVIARSTFNSSMNYRSVVVFGEGRVIEDSGEKMTAFAAISEHIAKGRWDDSRATTQKEIDSTAVVALSISEASAKIRTGPPKDEPEDYATDFWAGVIPFALQPLAPINDPQLRKDIALPAYLQHYTRS